MTDISEEYKKMLRDLHTSTHPERQPGDFTVDEYAAAQNPPLSRKEADNELEYMLRVGKVTKPPHKFIDGHLRLVYRLVS